MTGLARLGLLLSLTLAGAEGPGTISGTLDHPESVAAVVALDRETDKAFPGTIDAATGRFTIAGLPAGKAFDGRIDYRDGSRLEGVSLKVPPSDFEEEQPLSPEDIQTITTQVRDLNKFEDEVAILAIAGNAQHAAVVLNKLRTRPFVNSRPGEVVWRAERWYFVRPDEDWLKSPDELFLVLYRERLQKQDYDKKALTFDPALGGLAITAEAPTIDLGAISRPPAGPGVRLRSKPTE